MRTQGSHPTTPAELVRQGRSRTFRPTLRRSPRASGSSLLRERFARRPDYSVGRIRFALDEAAFFKERMPQVSHGIREHIFLKAGVWFRRGRLVIVSPDSLGTACPLSGRNSTYRLVQISGTGSVWSSPVGHRDRECALNRVVPAT
jgi:hypothetical protein